ncbi:MAG: hypothetical protein PHI06_06250 [Desulfobulbaceae bacterium]|nr:hypothetical protein [Desulfobulbaceae bacterium]
MVAQPGNNNQLAAMSLGFMQLFSGGGELLRGCGKNVSAMAI